MLRTLACGFALSAAVVQGAEQKTNPVSKVLELLDSLSAKVVKEGETEQKQYEDFAEWCEDVAREKQHEIQTANSGVEDLSAAIEKASADISNFESRIGELSAAVSTNEADLKSATQIREKEATDFTSEHSNLVEVVDTLSRAIGLLKRGSFAQLSSSKDLIAALQVVVSANVFSTHDRSKLSALMQESSEDSMDAPAGAPSSKVYESHSGAIIETLENMLEKAQQMKADAEKAEANSRHNFEMLKQGLEDEVAFQAKELEAAKKSKAATEEAKAQAEGDLELTQKGLKEATEYLADTRQDCMSKAADWEESQKSRASELVAIASAKKAIVELTGGASGRAYTGLLQVSSTSASRVDQSIVQVARKLKELGRRFQDTALMQLAFRAKVASTSSEDPFVKVKGLISEMIERLIADAQKEADHKAYCDKEMSETHAKIDEHTSTVDDLSAKIDKADALVSTLTEDIATLQSELAELAKTQQDMDSMRTSEHEEYVASKADYESGLQGISMALKILREYYAASEAAEEALVQQAPGATHQKASGEAGGIIGFLEVIESDFAANLASANAAESAGQEWYEKVSQDNKVTKVEKDQDVKYKSQEKKKTERVIAETKDDRSSVQTELDAVMEYLTQLKPACIAKPESYAERKKRREAEITGLKEALQILEGEAVAFLQRRN